MNGALVTYWREGGGWGEMKGWARFLNRRREEGAVGAVRLCVWRQTSTRSALDTSVPKVFDVIVGPTRELRDGVA